MTPPTNTKCCLAARPEGMPTRDTWDFTTDDAPEPGQDEVLIRVSHISLDPAMRGWIREERSYIPPVEIGEVMRAIAAGEVVASNFEGLQVGDTVSGLLGVQEYAVVNGHAVQKVDPSMAPIPTWLGALGMPGMTAYFGLLDIGDPKEGETVVVSAAAGAVGALVGQIAKIKGARAVGIAGGPEKCAYIVDELGFDAGIDYKNENVAKGLAEHCPGGIDVYFDNVGGPMLDDALARLARHGRVVICGAISQYNDAEFYGPKNYMSLLVNHATMTGFVMSDYIPRIAEGIRDKGQWVGEGKIKTREDIVNGLETFPESLNKLFTGENQGKLVLAVNGGG